MDPMISSADIAPCRVVVSRIFQTIYGKSGPKDSMAAADNSASDRAPVDDARDELRDAVPEAAATLRELLDAEDDRVRIRAAEAILDRAGVTKAKQITSTSAEREVGGKSTDGFPNDFF